MRVLLRCDGGGSLGVGHVMRSLALAEAAVAAGHEVLVAGRFEGAFLERQLRAAPVEVVRLASPSPGGGQGPGSGLPEPLERFLPDVVHIDSYDLSGWLPGSFVLSNIEDGTFGRRRADVVVDPTFGAELSPRPQDGSGWLLRGSRYTPVRRRVVDARRRGPIHDAARSVLVVMGGTDPVGLAPGAVQLLARTGLALEVVVIAVGENARRVRAAADGSALSLSVLAPVDDLASLMYASDLVISAAGTTIWELCCLGVPTAAVWAVDNQREGYAQVVAAGAAIGLGGPGLGDDERAADLLARTLADPRLRDALATAGRRVVDGLGAWRVVRMWETAQRQRVPGGPAPIDTAALTVRPATAQDSRQLWQWRNDPVTRSGSRSSAEVSWDDHERWLAQTLTRTDRLLLIVDDQDGAVGTVRWDLATEPAGGNQPEGESRRAEDDVEIDSQRQQDLEWEVSVTVAPRRRGQSLASALLRAGEEALPAGPQQGTGGRPGVAAYLAMVHRDNRASVRLFESSGYVPDLPPDPHGFVRYRKTAQVP